MARAVRDADLVVGAVLVPGARAPVLVSRPMVEAMAPGSVIVDVAVDQGGCVATTRPTSHTAPTYVEAGVIHYAVPNMPALVPRTATLALTNVTLPYVQALATAGTAAALASQGSGRVRDLDVAELQRTLLRQGAILSTDPARVIPAIG